MTLYLFKYCLPLLLGYTLFIGLAGRMNPFVKPEYPEERPSWFLGVWTGLTVALVLGIGMHMAYSLTLESAKALLPPTAFFMGVLLLPGFAGYSLYRRHISRELRETPLASASEPESLKQRLESDALWQGDERRAQHINAADSLYSPTTAESFAPSIGSSPDEDHHAPIVASFLNSAELQVMDTHEHPAANSEPDETFEAYLGADFDLATEASLDDYLDDTVFEEFHYSDLDLDATELDATRQIDMSDITGTQISESADNDIAELSLFDETEFRQPTDYDRQEEELASLEAAEDEYAFAHDDLMAAQAVSAEDTVNSANINVDEYEHDLAQYEHSAEASGSAESQSIAGGTYATSISNLQLGQRLSDELAAHEETSRQLRITRKVLARLTPSAQESWPEDSPMPLEEAEDKESLISLKEELAESLALQSSHLSDVNVEKEKRRQSEETCMQMRRELVQAKHDIRQSSAARAKALSTANKAIAFARQTLQVRALLEEELQMARNTLSKRQDTISSVIRELENEKERTQEEVAYMAQQLVVHDHQPEGHHSDEPSHGGMEHTLPTALNGKMTEIHQSGPDL